MNYSLDCTVIGVNDPPSTPVLNLISSTPDNDGNIYLSWEPSDLADKYYSFRDTSRSVNPPI
jgi:hypothetical protein